MGCEHVHTLGVNCFTLGARLIGCGSRLHVRRLGPTMADVGSVRPEAVVDPASLTRVALFAQLPARSWPIWPARLVRGVTLAGSRLPPRRPGQLLVHRGERADPTGALLRRG